MTMPAQAARPSAGKPADGYILSQTMLRIRDPERSIPFYRDVLGMHLFGRFDFPDMRFSLYFMGYPSGDSASVAEDGGRAEEIAGVFRQRGLLELTHNWGTEADPNFAGYHDGNQEPRGFGHIGITVPDVEAACTRFAAMQVRFVKRPEEGRMKGIGFIADPDGYWIEILSAGGIAALIVSMGADRV
jgi:lactoylglutathione lyase